jgi:hypothetical protein
MSGQLGQQRRDLPTDFGLRPLAVNSGEALERPMMRTTVYLKSIKGAQPPTQVLVFSHQYATMNLKMEWVTPTHLEVTYGPSERPADHVNLDFQVVECAGINISVRDLSSETTDASH